MTVQEHNTYWHRSRTIESYNEIYEKVKVYIAAHLSNPRLSIDDFALENHYTVRTVQRAISYYGTSWRDILRRYRMVMACRSLNNTTVVVAKIAQSVGYSSVAQFNRAFKKHCGLSPGEYRKACNGYF